MIAGASAESEARMIDRARGRAAFNRARDLADVERHDQ